MDAILKNYRFLRNFDPWVYDEFKKCVDDYFPFLKEPIIDATDLYYATKCDILYGIITNTINFDNNVDNLIDFYDSSNERESHIAGLHICQTRACMEQLFGFLLREIKNKHLVNHVLQYRSHLLGDNFLMQVMDGGPSTDPGYFLILFRELVKRKADISGFIELDWPVDDLKTFLDENPGIVKGTTDPKVLKYLAKHPEEMDPEIKKFVKSFKKMYKHHKHHKLLETDEIKRLIKGEKFSKLSRKILKKQQPRIERVNLVSKTLKSAGLSYPIISQILSEDASALGLYNMMTIIERDAPPKNVKRDWSWLSSATDGDIIRLIESLDIKFLSFKLDSSRAIIMTIDNILRYLTAHQDFKIMYPQYTCDKSTELEENNIVCFFTLQSLFYYQLIEKDITSYHDQPLYLSGLEPLITKLEKINNGSDTLRTRIAYLKKILLQRKNFIRVDERDYDSANEGFESANEGFESADEGFESVDE